MLPCHCPKIPGVLCSPLRLFLLFFVVVFFFFWRGVAVLTANSARPLDWGYATDEILCLTAQFLETVGLSKLRRVAHHL